MIPAPPEPPPEIGRGFAARVKGRMRRSPILSVFRHRDFRLFWLGALFSFTGTWIQTVAQGYLVYELTGDPAKLALTVFIQRAPTALFGPFAGSISDIYNKRTVLVIAQALMGVCALFLASATHFGFIEYWHILATASVLGVVSCIEMPTRQSVISRVVPPEDLAKAIPLNAMTFNSARIVGPAIGGYLLASFGYSACYFVNGVSYLSLIFAVLAVRTSLSAEQQDPQPVKDLLFEGMLYTFRNRHLRTLFTLETFTAVFGLFYITLMPAIAREMLGLDKQGLGYAYTAIGVGALTGLLINASLADKAVKAVTIRIAMVILGVGLLILSTLQAPQPWTPPAAHFPGLPLFAHLEVAFRELWKVQSDAHHTQMLFAPTSLAAYGVFVMTGMAAILQLNNTNTLFQTLAPSNLRGRVLAMHIWALAGISPIGDLAFGALAAATKEGSLTLGSTSFSLHRGGVPFCLEIGGACMLLGAAVAWLTRKGLAGLESYEKAAVS